MALTQDQIKANIDAIKQQGGSDADVQGYLTSIGGNPHQGAKDFIATGIAPGFDPNTPKRGFMGQILPTGGAILGGILGAAGGGLITAPTGPGVLPGAVAGAAVGAGIGGAGGEALQQFIEKKSGQRKAYSGQDIAKTGTTMAATEILAGPVGELAGGVLKASGKATAEAFIPTSMKEAKLLQAYKAETPFWDRVMAGVSGKSGAPTTAGSTAFEKGLLGTESMIGVQAKKGASNLWDNLINPALKNSSEKVNMPSFFKDVSAQIIKDNLEPSRQKALLKGLQALVEDYKGVKNVDMATFQHFKEGWAEFVPEKAYRGEPIAGAFNSVKDTASDLARQKIYDTLGLEIKQAYFDYGNLKGLQELGQKAMTGGKLKGGAGSFISAIKDMALVPAGTIGGQTVYKVGQGVELFGKPGARFVRDILLQLGQIGKDIAGPTQTQGVTTPLGQIQTQLPPNPISSEPGQ